MKLLTMANKASVMGRSPPLSLTPHQHISCLVRSSCSQPLSSLVPLLGCSPSHQSFTQFPPSPPSGIWSDVTCTAGLLWPPAEIVPCRPYSAFLFFMSLTTTSNHSLINCFVVWYLAPAGEWVLPGGRDFVLVITVSSASGTGPVTS